jgi:hypothetical protein
VQPFDHVRDDAAAPIGALAEWAFATGRPLGFALRKYRISAGCDKLSGFSRFVAGLCQRNIGIAEPHFGNPVVVGETQHRLRPASKERHAPKPGLDITSDKPRCLLAAVFPFLRRSRNGRAVAGLQRFPAGPF